jgi:hypothetical protein
MMKNIMPWLPGRSFGLSTLLPLDEVRRRLAHALEPRNRSRGGPAPFKGNLKDDCFRFVPAASGRNSFLPVIHGTIVQTDGGTRIEGTMSLHPLILVFMAGLSVCLLFIEIKNWQASTGRRGLEAICVAGLWAFALFELAAQSRKALRVLTEILDARAADRRYSV